MCLLQYISSPPLTLEQATVFPQKIWFQGPKYLHPESLALEEGILVASYPKIEWAASPSAGTGVFRAAGADSRLNKKGVFLEKQGRVTWKRKPEWRKRKKIFVSRLPEKFITIWQVLRKYTNFTWLPHVQIERVASVYHGFQIVCDTCNSHMWRPHAL